MHPDAPATRSKVPCCMPLDKNLVVCNSYKVPQDDEYSHTPTDNSKGTEYVTAQASTPNQQQSNVFLQTALTLIFTEGVTALSTVFHKVNSL